VSLTRALRGSPSGRKSSSVVSVLLATLALLAAIGCGGSDQPAETAAQTGESANGFTPYKVESQNFSVAVPDSWEIGSVDELLNENTADRLRQENPKLADAVDQLGDPGTVIKLIAYDPETSNGFSTNFNVGVFALPDAATEQQFYDLNVEQVRKGIGQAPSREELDLPGGHALHITWVIPGAAGAPVVDQYLFFSPGRGYVLTYSTLKENMDEYADTFEQSAESFLRLKPETASD
jgi:hypothetical protein